MKFITLANYIILCLVLLYIALQDVDKRTIHHHSLLMVICALIPLMFLQNQPPNIISAAIILLAGFLLFMVGVIGGGDVKLIVILSLSLANALVLQFLFLTAFLGGVIALFGLLFFRTSFRQKGVPYATAIVTAFVLVNPSAHDFLFLMGWK